MTEITVVVQPPPSIDLLVNPPGAVTVTPQGVGAQGPPGPQGQPGPAGPAGIGATYIWTQNAPLAVWTITHNLNGYPSVTVVDSGGNVVEGDVDYLDNNTMTVTFSNPFGGLAYLNM